MVWAAPVNGCIQNARSYATLDLRTRRPKPFGLPVRRAALLAVAAIAVVGPAGAQAATTGRAQLDNVFRLGTLYTATSERDMRNCERDGTCVAAIQSEQSIARTWLDATGRISQAGLSTADRSTRSSLLYEFQRYYLAADAFGRGLKGAYVQDLRQAIQYGAAASTKLGDRPWFNYMMTLAQCGAWQLKIRVIGENPCD